MEATVQGAENLGCFIIHKAPLTSDGKEWRLWNNRLKRGMCPHCGNQTHRITLMRNFKPLHNPGYVDHGVCIHPHCPTSQQKVQTQSNQGTQAQSAADPFVVAQKLSRLTPLDVSVEDLIGYMKSFPLSEEIQEHGCRLLNEKTDYRKITDVGGIGVIMSAMQTHMNSTKVQATVCGVLAALACNVRGGTSLIVEAGGVPMVLAAMRNHEESVELQDCCCDILGTMANDEVQSAKIGQSGGIHLIVAAMRRFESVGYYGRLALETLTKLPANQRLVEAEGGIPSNPDDYFSNLTFDVRRTLR